METKLLKGNCKDVLPTLPDNSIDSIVTDPPYELGFMGKSWDASGIAYDLEVWRECLRVLKPGGHLLAFGGSRTYHRLACAIEDAGFEIRDQIMWVYGSGFPKSLDVSKAIDKAAGVEFSAQPASGVGFMRPDGRDGYNITKNKLTRVGETSDDARIWEGWGTALKPAHEPIVVARKPLVGTVAANVLEWGTGAINIDGTRIPHLSEADRASATPQGKVTSNRFAGAAPDVANDGRVEVARPDTSFGRWPANFIHDGSDEVLELFPETRSGANPTRRGGLGYHGASGQSDVERRRLAEQGSAARFFYCAKASKTERNAGLEHLPTKTAGEVTDRKEGSDGLKSPRAGAGRTSGATNFHPTVKPLDLMRYLIRLVTPPNGTVLDPFAGSGTTLVAAIHEQKHAIGIELTDDYWPIVEARITHATQS